MYNKAVLPQNPNCLRRTLSADISSSSSHINSPSMKKAQSSNQLDAFVLDNTNNNNEKEKDIWSSIVSKKADSGSGSDTPYVHPLVKRAASSLSTKSLEICTESLGSETGSDGFGSEESDSPQPELHGPISNFTVTDIIEYETSPKEYYERAPPKTMTSSLFPPPMASLSHRMQSHRHGGRLLVDAVTVPATTACLRSLRRDGRLLLTLDSHSNDVADYERDGNKITVQAQNKTQVEKAAEYLVPFLRGCKVHRRPFLFLGPHCIATS